MGLLNERDISKEELLKAEIVNFRYHYCDICALRKEKKCEGFDKDIKKCYQFKKYQDFQKFLRRKD